MKKGKKELLMECSAEIPLMSDEEFRAFVRVGNDRR